MTTLIQLILRTGYYIGLGIEGFIALVAGVMLALLLANVFVKDDEPEEPDPPKQPKPKKEKQPKATAATTAAADQQQPASKDAGDKNQTIVVNVYNTGAQAEQKTAEPPKAEQPAAEQPAAEEADKKDKDIKFAESKSIDELYAELVPEQKKFFDELKAKAMSKPSANLSVTRNYESVKVGKSSILKLVIRKGVTVAEFTLENELLKSYKKETDSKAKSKIRVRPTVISVTDASALKTALDMIDIAYEQLFQD